MFLFIPLRTEKAIKKLPIVTIGLIVINIIILFISSAAIKRQQKELEILLHDMIIIESAYFGDSAYYNPGIFLDIEKHHEKILAGEIIPIQSECYKKWFQVYEQYQSLKSQTVFQKYGFKPNAFHFFDIFTAMFLHGGIFHLLGNMLFLWAVGANMEERMGALEFTVLYIVSGFFAALFHKFAFPGSDIPCIGASGAVSGIMGAFLINYYKTKIRGLFSIGFFYWRMVSIQAYLLLPFYFIKEILEAQSNISSGVAHWAHIGGFVLGAGIMIAYRSSGLLDKVEVFNDNTESEMSKFNANSILNHMNKEEENKPESDETLLPLIRETNLTPRDIEAWLNLAECYYEKDCINDAVQSYDMAVKISIADNNADHVCKLYSELLQKNIIHKLHMENIFHLAAFLNREKRFKAAVRLFGIYIKQFPNAIDRPNAIYQTHIILKNHMGNEEMAKRALVLLKREYPGFIDHGESLLFGG